ncbi:Aste57867_15406 [Aphanomyces stellatus]|uniref:Aste57867_15406 protein n=1 Tax=Aphanomyces stellatus TaxID=120398 RepID=A0A485L320_9STRA|nr:hypothetical protein As57867_015350 [Aphanomyces stellatus]VFT92209.1 Aste57867_15406 [Aphanomyces stellatus]
MPTHEGDDAAARRARTRLYARNAMRQLRQKEKDEMASLRDEIQHLEGELRRRTRVHGPLLLPWKDVAAALKASSHEVVVANGTLKTRAQTTVAMMRALHRWVAATASSIPVFPTRPTWRNTSLLAHDASRTLGKAWIVQQMYANTDAVFYARAFPAVTSDVELYDLDVEFDGADDNVDGFQVVARRQYVQKRLFCDYVKGYEWNIVQNLKVEGFRRVHNQTVAETTDATILHRLTTSSGEFVNVLTASFHPRAGRCVFVAQSIVDDEAVTHEPHFQRNRFLWTDMRRVDDETVQIRTLYVMSQAFSKRQGYVPLQDDARRFYCDLSTVPEKFHECVFRRRVREIFNQANVDQPNK